MLSSSIKVAANREGQPDSLNNPNNFNISNIPYNRREPTTTAAFASASKISESSAGTPEQSVSLNHPVTSDPPVPPFPLGSPVPLSPPAPPFFTSSPVPPAGSLTPASLVTPVKPVGVVNQVTPESQVPLPPRNQSAPLLVLAVRKVTTVLSASLPSSAPRDSVQPDTLGHTPPVSQGQAVTRDPNRPAYNPFEHRHVKHPTSVASAIINLMKACLGTGILAMPTAYKNAGLVMGTIGIMFSGFVVTHGIYVLVKTAQEICVVAEKPHMSFAETCGAAFTYGPKRVQFMGHFMKNFADGSLVFCYTGVLCIYVVFIAESFREVIDGLFDNSLLSTTICSLIIFVPLALICQIRSLKYVTPFSAIADIGILIVFFITMFFVFSDLPSPKERAMVMPISNWPFFIGIAVFAIEGIGVVVPVENEMRNPEKFLGCPGVLNVTMSMVVTLYGIVGFLGYLKYGNEVKGSITLSLPQDSFVGLFTKFLMAVVIFFTYALQFYVPMEAVTRRWNLEELEHHVNLIQISIRCSIVAFSVLIAIIVPKLELVITLVGAIFFSTCGIILPAVTQTVWKWDKNLGPFKYILWKNIIIFVIGVVTMISASVSAIIEAV